MTTHKRTITPVVREYVDNNAGVQIRLRSHEYVTNGQEWIFFPSSWPYAVCASTVKAFDHAKWCVSDFPETPEEVLRQLAKRAPDWQMAAYLNTYNDVPEVSLLSVAYATRSDISLPLLRREFTPAGLATMDHARRVAMGPIGKHWEWVLRCIHMHCGRV